MSKLSNAGAAFDGSDAMASLQFRPPTVGLLCIIPHSTVSLSHFFTKLTVHITDFHYTVIVKEMNTAQQGLENCIVVTNNECQPRHGATQNC